MGAAMTAKADTKGRILDIAEASVLQKGFEATSIDEIVAGVAPERLAAIRALTPLGRAGTPEEAAGAVYLLCLPEADFVSGQVLVAGGGLLI